MDTRLPTPADAKARAQVQLPDGTLATLVWTPALNRKPAANGQGATKALVVVAGKHHRVTATELQVLLP